MSYYMFMFYLILLLSLAITLLIFIHKNEDLEKENENLKALIEKKEKTIESSRNSLTEAEEKISNMNYLMEFQRQKIDILETQKKELVTNYDKAN